MAVEVQGGRYCFIYDVKIPPNTRRRRSSSSSSSSSSRPSPLPASEVPPPSAFPSQNAPVYPPPVVAAHPPVSKKLHKVVLKRKRGRTSDGFDGAPPGDSPEQASEEDPAIAPQETLQAVSEDHEAIPGDRYVPFVHNPMHDFESLIWIGNYFIFNRVVDEPERQQSQQDLDAQRSYAYLLFSGDIPPRRDVFDSINSNEFDEQVKHLHPSLHAIGELMKVWVKVMKVLYVQLEMDPTSIASSSVKMGIRHHIDPYLMDILDILKQGDIKVTRFPVAPAVAAPATVIDEAAGPSDTDKLHGDVVPPGTKERLVNVVDKETTLRPESSTRPVTKKVKTGKSNTKQTTSL